jgi:hypothetical protein
MNISKRWIGGLLLATTPMMALADGYAVKLGSSLNFINQNTSYGYGFSLAWQFDSAWAMEFGFQDQGKGNYTEVAGVITELPIQAKEFLLTRTQPFNGMPVNHSLSFGFQLAQTGFEDANNQPILDQNDLHYVIQLGTTPLRINDQTHLFVDMAYTLGHALGDIPSIRFGIQWRSQSSLQRYSSPLSPTETYVVRTDDPNDKIAKQHAGYVRQFLNCYGQDYVGINGPYTKEQTSRLSRQLNRVGIAHQRFAYSQTQLDTQFIYIGPFYNLESKRAAEATVIDLFDIRRLYDVCLTFQP